MSVIDDARRVIGPDKHQAIHQPEWRRIVAGLVAEIDRLNAERIAAPIPPSGACTDQISPHKVLTVPEVLRRFDLPVPESNP